MKLHIVFERAKDGRIWASFPDLESAIVGNGATIDEARGSLLESLDLARKHGDPFTAKTDVVAVEVTEVA